MVTLAFVDVRQRPVLFVIWAIVAGGGYLVALRLLGRLREGENRGLALCLVLGALWRVPLLVQPPQLSSDVYRYVWDGRLRRLSTRPSHASSTTVGFRAPIPRARSSSSAS